MNNEQKKKKILAIDDEPVINRVSVMILTAEGFEVDVAINGLVAKEMALKEEYDYYLSDIRTPAMNGMQFYEYLRSEQPGKEDRVIFTTGDVLSTDVKDFLRERSNLFLPKPFTPNELRAVIRQAVSAQPAANNN
jgi:CheY-like chemotaxis protein